MTLRKLTAAGAVVLCMTASAGAAMNPIQNPADSIRNPADTMTNPAAQIYNPASKSYNPASRVDSSSPLSPPTPPVSVQPVPRPPVAVAAPAPQPAPKLTQQTRPQPGPAIQVKRYGFKTAGAYVNAAKQAFIRDDYGAFISITEDALRRISAGTLKSSLKTKQKLIKYRVCGYGLLE